VSALRRAAKALRAWPPLNRPATTMVRAALRRPPEAVASHLPRVGPVESRLPNGARMRMWSGGDDWVPNRVFWFGWQGYETGESAIFWERPRTARVTLDIGAHVGFYSLLAGHANPQGRVFGFEAYGPTAIRFRRNLAMNALANVEVVEVAVGERIGEAPFFHVPNGIPCSAGLAGHILLPYHPHSVTTMVPVITVDAFLEGRGLTGVDLVKMDTEGTEPQVLEGMAETLQRDRPTVIAEVLGGREKEAPLRDLMTPLGYTMHIIFPDGPRPRDDVDHETGGNFLFLPPAA
jgi:FkbM family methyltransferase